MASSQGRIQMWEKKYQKAEDDLGKLKTTAIKAIQDYEDLEKKYQANQAKHEEVLKLYKNTQTELSKLSNVSEAVIHDYHDLKVNLEVEQECRKGAETYASKVVKENKDIKRKSQAILMQAGFDLKQFDILLDDDGELEDKEPGEMAQLKKSLDELRDQLIQNGQELNKVSMERDEAFEMTETWQNKVRQINIQLEAEKKNHAITKDLLEEHDRTIEQFSRVNTLVYQELEDLKAKYEEEKLLREEAEKYAAQREQETTAMKRQSSILLLSVENEDKLKEALEDVERLTSEMESAKHESNVKIKELEDQLAESVDVHNVESLENKLEVAAKENESLEEQVKKSEEKIKEYEEKVKKLEADLEKALMKPIPPPPPPLPPPLVPTSTNPLSALRMAITGKKGKQPPASIKPLMDSHPHQDAMKEMINRIKKGVPLRSHTNGTVPVKKDSQAIHELGSMLATLKKKRMVNETLGQTSQDGADSELMESLRRRRLKTDGDLTETEKEEPIRRSSCDPIINVEMPAKTPEKSVATTEMTKPASPEESPTKTMSPTPETDELYEEASSVPEEPAKAKQVVEDDNVYEDTENIAYESVAAGHGGSNKTEEDDDDEHIYAGADENPEEPLYELAEK